MQTAYTHAHLAALRVPVLQVLTLYPSGRPLPCCWLDPSPRPEVAALAHAHRLHGPLTFSTVWVTGYPLSTGTSCWLVVEVQQPRVDFALSFPLPAHFANLVEIVTSRLLTLLCGDCPAWLHVAGRRAEEVEVERLQPVLAESLTLALDAGGCDRLARHLLGWWTNHQASET